MPDVVTVIEIGEAGPQLAYVGPDASPTPVYVPGTGGGGATESVFEVAHTQDVPQSVWTVEHPRGLAVAWSLRTAAGALGWNYVVDPVDDTHTRISMDDPTSGTVHLLMRRAA